MVQGESIRARCWASCRWNNQSWAGFSDICCVSAWGQRALWDSTESTRDCLSEASQTRDLGTRQAWKQVELPFIEFLLCVKRYAKLFACRLTAFTPIWQNSYYLRREKSSERWSNLSSASQIIKKQNWDLNLCVWLEGLSFSAVFWVEMPRSPVGTVGLDCSR